MQRILILVTIVFLILLLGSTLFALVEGVGFFDALYFTMATVTTTGYGDLVPRSQPGHWVAIVLMLGGGGSALLLGSLVTTVFVEGRLRKLIGVRKMKKAIEGMRDHYIVCGYGKLGRLVAQQLEAGQADFVLIENNPQKAMLARERGHAVVEGDATLAETLAEANLDRARGLAATMSDDAENLYIGITVRTQRADLPVVCRSSSERVRPFFHQAGIVKTISTDEMGARRLVGSLTRPEIVEFMDEITQQIEGKPSLHAVRVEEGGALVGRTLVEARLRDDYGIIVLAIHREGTYLPNPRADERLQASDIMILIGRPERVARLRAQLGGPA